MQQASSISQADFKWSHTTVQSVLQTGPSRANLTNSVLTDEEEEEREPPPRRYRPVFVAFKQWNARDPKVEVRMKRAEKYHKDMVARYGHPFEHLRPVPVVATYSVL